MEAIKGLGEGGPFCVVGGKIGKKEMRCCLSSSYTCQFASHCAPSLAVVLMESRAGCGHGMTSLLLASLATAPPQAARSMDAASFSFSALSFSN